MSNVRNFAGGRDVGVACGVRRTAGFEQRGCDGGSRDYYSRDDYDSRRNDDRGNDDYDGGNYRGDYDYDRCDDYDDNNRRDDYDGGDHDYDRRDNGRPDDAYRRFMGKDQVERQIRARVGRRISADGFPGRK